LQWLDFSNVTAGLLLSVVLPRVGLDSMDRGLMEQVREFCQELKTTGMLCETTRWVADELVEPLKRGDQGRSILEVGAGMGAITKRLLQNMRDDDQLLICEINPRFVRRLKQRLEDNPCYQKHSKRIEFFEGPIQELQRKHKFDVIVCSLPFLNFNRPLVEEIFKKLEEFSTPATVMTYYEYTGLRQIAKHATPAPNRHRIKEIENFFKEQLPKKRANKKLVWLNLPPVRVYTLKIGESC
jgi:phospholipid N-methyltransferase